MINRKVEIEYGDQNDLMERFLPRAGKITHKLTSAEWGEGWYAVLLDLPFTYPVNELREAALKKRTKPLTVSYFLIKSRWQDHSIDAKGASVFVLLAE
ncbi:MAG: hypothetical protein ABL952_05415, partial [Pyrinomonadaceae bacterium]